MGRLLLALTLLALALPAPAAAIVNGQPTERDWPFTGYLEYGREEADNEEGQTCGLSLVAPAYALTAAHCVRLDLGAGERVPVPAELLTVVLGRRDKRATTSGERLPVARVIEHEDWDPEAQRFDVALLELGRPAKARPVLVAGAGEEPAWAPGSAVTVLGWGYEYLEQPLAPNHLNEGRLFVHGDETCRREGYEPVTDLCAHGGAAGTAICFGDSGGPLLADVAGGLRLVGVVSWMSEDDGPCSAGQWSMFMRIGAPPLRDWIAARVPGAVAPPVPAPAPAPPAAAPAPAPKPAAPRKAKRRSAKKAACRRRAKRLRGAKRRRALRRCARRNAPRSRRRR